MLAITAADVVLYGLWVVVGVGIVLAVRGVIENRRWRRKMASQREAADAKRDEALRKTSVNGQGSEPEILR